MPDGKIELIAMDRSKTATAAVERISQEIAQRHGIGNFWTTATINEITWRLFSELPDVKAGDVRASAYYKRGVKMIGGWSQMLDAAGVENEREARWSSEKVIAEIQRLHGSGVRIRGKLFEKNYPALCKAAHQCCGGLPQAVAAAGIEIQPLFGTKKASDWTVQEIVEHIRILPLEVLRSERRAREVAKDVVCASYALFGPRGWTKAIEAAGRSKPVAESKWSRGEIIRQLNALADESGVLPEDIQKTHAQLRNATYKYFGKSGWTEALRAAGVKTAREMHTWSEERIVRELKTIADADGYLPYNMHITHKLLYQALYKYFGAKRIDEALLRAEVKKAPSRARNIPRTEKLALVSKEIKKKMRKAQVISEMKILKDSGALMQGREFHRNHGDLMSRAYRLFGSWENALRAADIEVEKNELVRGYTKDEVLFLLRGRKENGANLTQAEIRKSDQSLVRRIKKIFGQGNVGWGRALTAIGVDPATVDVKYTDFSKEEIAGWIQKRKVSGRTFRLKSIIANFGPEDTARAKAAVRMYGSWEQALLTHGIDPKQSQVPRQKKWTVETLIEELQRRVQERKPITSRAVRKEADSFYKAGIRELGAWETLIEKAKVRDAFIREKFERQSQRDEEHAAQRTARLKTEYERPLPGHVSLDEPLGTGNGNNSKERTRGETLAADNSRTERMERRLFLQKILSENRIIAEAVQILKDVIAGKAVDEDDLDFLAEEIKRILRDTESPQSP